MHLVPLASGAIQVSELGLGTDNYGSRVPAGAAFSLLDQFVEAGGTLIDTANIYAEWAPGCSGGESEAVIGQWLSSRGCRDRTIISTKVGFPYSSSRGGLQASKVERECESSLRRLRTDHIDLYFAHCDDRSVPYEEMLGAFSKLVAEGKVRHVGLSNWPTWRVVEAQAHARAHRLSPIDALQLRHTYLRPGAGADFAEQVAVDRQLLDYCAASGLPLLAYSVLLNGAYTRRSRSIGAEYEGPDSKARLAALQAVAAETATSPNQVVVAWLLQGVPRVIPVIGATQPEQLAENLSAADLHLTSDQMARLNAAGHPHHPAEAEPGPDQTRPEDEVAP